MKDYKRNVVSANYSVECLLRVFHNPSAHGITMSKVYIFYAIVDSSCHTQTSSTMLIDVWIQITDT